MTTPPRNGIFTVGRVVKEFAVVGIGGDRDGVARDRRVLADRDGNADRVVVRPGYGFRVVVGVKVDVAATLADAVDTERDITAVVSGIAASQKRIRFLDDEHVADAIATGRRPKERQIRVVTRLRTQGYGRVSVIVDDDICSQSISGACAAIRVGNCHIPVDLPGSPLVRRGSLLRHGHRDTSARRRRRFCDELCIIPNRDGIGFKGDVAIQCGENYATWYGDRASAVVNGLITGRRGKDDLDIFFGR